MSEWIKILIDLLVEKSFKWSAEPTFKLVSGRMSNYYVNCKPTTLHPIGMMTIGNIIYDMVEKLDITGIGGLQFGACPISDAVAYTSALRRTHIKSFSIRKELKDHGVIQWIEGDMKPGERVVIIDDVATTGGSTIKAIERARQSGLFVVKAIVLVDRQEGGLQNIARHAPVQAVITREMLMAARK